MRGARGFTLIELMTVVALLAILAGLAAPGMQRLMSVQRLRSASYDLVADLTLARSEALKRGTQVTVSAQTGGWLKGWTVQTATATPETLAQHNSLGSGLSTSTTPATLTFDINGRSTSATPWRFGLTDNYGGKRCVLLDPSGRARTSTTDCP